MRQRLVADALEDVDIGGVLLVIVHCTAGMGEEEGGGDRCGGVDGRVGTEVNV